MTKTGASSRPPRRTGKIADAVRPGPPIDSVLRLILAQMPAVVWATDAELRFTHSEGGGLAGLGIAQNEVVGIDLFRYFGTEDPTYLPIKAHLDALAGEPQTYEFEWVERTYLSHLEPLRALGGRIVGVVGTSIDITDLKLAERDRRETLEALGRSETARRHLLSRLVDAQEEQTRRIAADVHDGPVQKMTAVGLRLHMIGERSSDPDTREAILEIEGSVGESIREMRNLLFRLVPPDLERDGLEAALGGLLGRLETDAGIRVDLDASVSAEPPLSVGITAYRIVQEAIANVRKHSRATTVHVTLRSSEDGVSIVVRDDGVGFAPTTVAEDGHIGLRVMHERALAAGGRLDVDAAPGRGATISFELPRALP